MQDEVVAKEPTTFFFADIAEGDMKENSLFIDGAFVVQEDSLDVLKEKAMDKLYKEFISRKDGVMWVEHAKDTIYGYAREQDDVTNFLAAKETAALGGEVLYRVHLKSGEKALKSHTHDMFCKALLQASQEQVEEYKNFETQYKKILACKTKEELGGL